MKIALVASWVLLAFTACSSSINASKMERIREKMTVGEVENLLGQPAHIDQAETTGLRGEVYHYPGPTGEGRVIFVNETVFRSEFIPGGKSS